MECALDVLTGAVETKGAYAMTNSSEDIYGSVCRHCHLPVINVAPTYPEVDVEEKGLGALL
jgi:cytochrome c5